MWHSVICFGHNAICCKIIITFMFVFSMTSLRSFATVLNTRSDSLNIFVFLPLYHHSERISALSNHIILLFLSLVTSFIESTYFSCNFGCFIFDVQILFPRLDVILWNSETVHKWTSSSRISQALLDIVTFSVETERPGVLFCGTGFWKLTLHETWYFASAATKSLIDFFQLI